jgi:hypothetical protein
MWNKVLRLACWNTYSVRGRKQELDYYVGQHGIDICVLIETQLRSGDVFRMANYICHRNDRLTGDETATLIRHGIDHHAVPVQDLEHLEVTAIRVMLASKPVKIKAL